MDEVMVSKDEARWAVASLNAAVRSVMPTSKEDDREIVYSKSQVRAMLAVVLQSTVTLTEARLAGDAQRESDALEYAILDLIRGK